MNSLVAIPDCIPEELIDPDFQATWQAAHTPAARSACLLHFVRHAIGHRDLELTRRIIEEALHLALSAESSAQAALCLAKLGWVEVNLGHYARALEYCQQAQMIAPEEEHQLEVECQILSTSALPRVWIGDELGARRDMQRAVELALCSQKPELLLGAYVNSAWISTLCEKPELSGHFHNLLEEEINSRAPQHLKTVYLAHLYSGRAHDQYLLAVQARQKHRLEAEQEAIQTGTQLLEQCEALPNLSRALQLMIFTLKAHFLRLQGALTGAEQQIRLALPLCEQGDPGLVPLAYVSVAEVRMAQGEYTEALRFYQDALTLIGEGGRYREVQNILQRMAAAHWASGEYAQAMQTMQEALQQSQRALVQVTEAEEHHQLLSQLRSTEPHWQALLRQAEQQASHDPLTGLLNRRGWQDGLSRLQADATQEALVAFLDIDHFKHVNDQFSHAVGDEVLQLTAHLLQHTLPPESLLARYGGEEFTLLLSPCPPDPAALLNRCREAVQNHDWSPQLGKAALTISIGYAVGQVEHVTLLMKSADQALYTAKNAGRNQVQGVEAMAAD